MEMVRPSATAQRVAMKRAAHQLLDDPRVFEDPVAACIIGKEDALALGQMHIFFVARSHRILDAGYCSRCKVDGDCCGWG